MPLVCSGALVSVISYPVLVACHISVLTHELIQGALQYVQTSCTDALKAKYVFIFINFIMFLRLSSNYINLAFDEAIRFKFDKNVFVSISHCISEYRYLFKIYY